MRCFKQKGRTARASGYSIRMGLRLMVAMIRSHFERHPPSIGHERSSCFRVGVL